MTTIRQLRLTRHGLHARPAATLAEAARRFECLIEIESRGGTANAKSVIGLMKLQAGGGSTVRITVTGPREEEAIADLASLGEVFEQQATQ